MSDTCRLFYIFRNKMETEEVNRWACSARAKQLYNCTQSEIFMLESDGKLYTYNWINWKVSDTAPDEIKLAAMLL